MKLDFTIPTYNCMAAISAIDGEIHESEQKVLKNFRKQWNLKADIEDPNDLANNQEKCEDVFDKNFSRIIDLGQLSNIYELLHHCNEVADADKNLHSKEESLLHLIQKRLGANNFFITKDAIDWNEEQQEVLNLKKNERSIIEAPPGAGKTELIAKKVFDLIDNEGVKPHNILLISFTNNAVREMQERVFHYSKDKFHRLNISTIDSKAFRLNSALREDYQVRGGYEKNIEDFLKILRSNSIDFLDDWDELEHIFIDEAQDLVELRKDVCDEFIKLANKDTGISIFGDSCQQIFPWETKEKKLTEKDKESLIDLIHAKYYDEFKALELNTIHRTDDNTLIKLLDNMRLNIMSSKDSLESPIQNLDESKENLMEMEIGDDYLFLFRQNQEVVHAAYQLTAAKKIFRLKSTSGKYPSYYKSWLAKLIKYAKSNDTEILNKEDFMEFAKTISSRHLINDKQKMYIWESLLKYAAHDRNEISIASLQDKLRSNTKLLELKNTDFGFRGPKLSTIHASKGSQAEKVLLNVSRKEKIISKDESKVIFVGISRAKQDLKTSDLKSERYNTVFSSAEFKNNSYASSKKLKRMYRLITNKSAVDNLKQKPIYIMEVGLCGDYTPLSIVDQSYLSYAESKKTQEFLTNLYLGNDDIYDVYAKRENIHQREFKIYLRVYDEEYILGAFSSQVIDNIWTIARNYLEKTNYVPPLKLDNLNILDVASYSLSKSDFDEDDKKRFFKPYIKDEAWLYPVIYGSARFILEYRSK